MRLITFVCLIAVFLGSAPVARADAPPSISELQVLSKIPGPFLHMLAGNTGADAHGIAKENRAQFVSVEYQRVTDRYAPLAVAEHDRSALAKSLQVLSFTFSHMGSDGRFEFNRSASSGRGAAWTESGPAGFFLADAGHTFALLRESRWFQTGGALSDARQQVSALQSKDAKAIDWLLSQQDGLRADPAPNRELTYGVAFYLNGTVLGNQDAIGAGKSFAFQALRQQRGDGTFPELGGFDSSYQAVTLCMLEVLYLHADPNDSNLRGVLWSALQRGMAREAQNLQGSGEMSTVGNTRVSGVYSNGRQHIDSLHVTMAFLYYGAMSGDQTYQREAAALMRHYYPSI